MPLPTEFNDTEHLQSIVRRYVNKLVRQDFADLNDVNGVFDENVNTTRASMRVAVTHKDADAIGITLLRLFVYYFVYGKAKSLMPDIFGEPKHSVDERRAYRPEVKLVFRENKNVSLSSKYRREGDISFRLMNKTSDTLTQAEVNALALKIKNKFTKPTKRKWDKGKTLYSYTDKQNGVQFQLLARTKADAKSLMTDVLSLIDLTPDWSKFNEIENDEPTNKYPETVGTRTILGKQYKKVVRRPNVTVYFAYATLVLDGIPNGINLVDTTGFRSKPIERV